MVTGLELFRDWFTGFEDCYTLIGGAACDLWMEEQRLSFRATVDLDLVLVYEGQRPDFVRRLWAFVKKGAYQGYQAGESPRNFYRFHKPKSEGFPLKLEICTKRPISVPSGAKFARIESGEGLSSLSALLLDPAYFDLVRKNSRLIKGVPTATGSCLIPLKAKAWLNLSDGKASGLKTDQGDVEKHRPDVFRLLVTLVPTDKIELPASVREDLRKFIDLLPLDSPVWPRIAQSCRSSSRLRLPPPAELIRAFREFYDLD